MRVLLAEDDPLLGDGIAAGLKQAGFDVDWVRDGAAAHSALATGDYAAVVLDIGLPRASGFDVLARLQIHERAVTVGPAKLRTAPSRPTEPPRTTSIRDR